MNPMVTHKKDDKNGDSGSQKNAPPADKPEDKPADPSRANPRLPIQTAVVRSS